MKIVNDVSIAYALAEMRWSDQKSSKGVEYMTHIDGGLAVLDKLGAGLITKAAWCAHGLFQSDDDLIQTIDMATHKFLNPLTLIYAMEYRRVANLWLFHEPVNVRPKIELHSVRSMLIADKVQNYANLLAHYRDHINYDGLVRYFNDWLDHLGVKYEDFSDLPLTSRFSEPKEER